MSQSSLEAQFKDAGIPIKRGVKIRSTDPADRVSAPKRGSDIWMYRWARNSYLNYPTVQRGKGVRILADSAKDIPSIIVGIGPSLDETWPDLYEAQGRAILIATDAAFRPMMAHGIRPDLVLSYDCKPEQKLLWETVPDHDVPVLFDSCAHPASIESWRGPVLFYNHFHQVDELSHLILPHIHPKIGQIPSGGTVGNVALLLAKILGCSPTLAVGMDFCYEKVSDTAWTYRAADYRFEDGKWIPGEVKALYDNTERMARSFMSTIKGMPYRMDPELGHYQETFVNFVSHFKIETINCSPNGTLRDIIATMTLGDALDRFCPKTRDLVPFDSIIRELGPDPREGR